MILTGEFYPGIFRYMVYTVFHGLRSVATGSATDLVEVLKEKPQGELLVFDNSTGSQVDLDRRGQPAEITHVPADIAAEPRGRGRPRLGVIAKEVTLLPRHWDWLNVQPGGASVALRKLVDEARKTSGDRDRVRAAQEAAYRFMSAIAGNLPGFEEATRALFAYDRRSFTHLVANWPEDVRDYAVRLAFADREPAQTQNISQNS
jgi:hypothetical protein